MKKKGSVKPKKKETAAAAKKGGKGARGATPASNATPPLEEVVAEGGMPTGEGRREAPAASSAGQVAPAKRQPAEESPPVDRAGATYAAVHQGKAN